MIDTKHMPAMPLLSFTMAGGNGFDDMQVLMTDPLAYVQSEYDKRTTVKPFDTSKEIVVTDPKNTGIMTRDLSQPIKDWLAGEMKGLTDNAKGLVIVVMLALLGIVLIAFGLWQITKD